MVLLLLAVLRLLGEKSLNLASNSNASGVKSSQLILQGVTLRIDTGASLSLFSVNILS